MIVMLPEGGGGRILQLASVVSCLAAFVTSACHMVKNVAFEVEIFMAVWINFRPPPPPKNRHKPSKEETKKCLMHYG